MKIIAKVLPEGAYQHVGNYTEMLERMESQVTPVEVSVFESTIVNNRLIVCRFFSPSDGKWIYWEDYGPKFVPIQQAIKEAVDKYIRVSTRLIRQESIRTIIIPSSEQEVFYKKTGQAPPGLNNQ